MSARAAVGGVGEARRYDAELVAAAKFERDRRGARYPQLIYDGKLDAESAAIDYQCWVAIAEWLETERFFSFAGGANPDRDGAPIVSWPELEAAAQKALRKVELKLAGEGWLDGMEESPTARRRNLLTRIHRAIQLRHESVDAINAELSRPALEAAHG
jgi:hypothetical protein